MQLLIYFFFRPFKKQQIIFTINRILQYMMKKQSMRGITREDESGGSSKEAKEGSSFVAAESR